MEKIQITVTGKCSGDEDRIRVLKESSPEAALEALIDDGEDLSVSFSDVPAEKAE